MATYSIGQRCEPVSQPAGDREGGAEMNYTPEQLREEALSIERDGRGADEVDSKWLIGLLRSHADALEKLKIAEEALKHQRTALTIVRDRQRCNVSEADLTKGIAQIDAALSAISGKP